MNSRWVVCGIIIITILFSGVNAAGDLTTSDGGIIEDNMSASGPGIINEIPMASETGTDTDILNAPESETVVGMPLAFEAGIDMEVQDAPEDGTVLGVPSAAEITEILNAHNYYRSLVGCPPLTWSSTRATAAQTWANYLRDHNLFEHSCPGGGCGYGENIAGGYGSWTAAINGWASEKSYFIYGPFGDGSSTTGHWYDVGHYTQIVWYDTTQCGCAAASHPTWGTVYVCQYTPPGNYWGQYPYPQPDPEDWTKTYGGDGYDYGNSVQQTTDGGYIIAGTFYSTSKGYQVYLIKTNANGVKLWTKTYGGDGYDYGNSVQQTTDGGYIIAGTFYSTSKGNQVYLIKTNANGVKLWAKTYGGDGSDVGYSVQQTSDGGYIIAGRFGSTSAKGNQVYLVKTNANGGKLWAKAYGGDGADYGNSVQQTSDGGYIIAGTTSSFGKGLQVYLIKTGSDG